MRLHDRLCPLEREQLLRAPDPAKGVAAYGHEACPTSLGRRIAERRRYEHLALHSHYLR